MVEREKTTIAIFVEDKPRLDGFKLCTDESYPNEISRLLDVLEEWKQFKQVHPNGAT